MESKSHFNVNNGAQVGTNYGEFRAHFHLPPGKSGTEPNKVRID